MSEVPAVSDTAATDNAQRVINLAFTGASGAPYGLRLLQCLVAAGCRVQVMISKAAQIVIATETDLKLPGTPPAMQQCLSEYSQAAPGQVLVFGREDWFSPPASGSGEKAPLVICPCSTGTLSALATGASNNLIERAGDVALKERRQLILVPREAPYSEVHLENMLKLTRMGAVIMPASPGFYHNPETINDLVDFVVARLLDHLGVDQKLMPRWGEERVARKLKGA
ncbi:MULTISPECIES: flavin prenyltransferase UbiX [unclassified Marinobacter]|uniref:flavin prenyltransferase UbiX n=1 Tax=unclassified Marinobacter TaxID=83889 RepID=UPI000BF57CF5|nr:MULTISPECIES: flavin prenyltransferase UbiX [unclassified Marinobacter]PFG09763.1 4-hydroxy-3-polyprenylbenzoate decarboxylase [Marinobacter sp. LV10MA510-1]PFG51692.1 4-hydroxy-3-polyprenylbenzoate decarboxylase [Marinobacter sp. LV10R520-4]